jgi:hypothetical protein
MSRVIIIALFLVFIAAEAYSARLYLVPNFRGEPGSLTVGDICRVEAKPGLYEKIASVKIPASIYEDGYVDRMEVKRLLNNEGNETLLIYGSAVRVRSAGVRDPKHLREWLVRKGDEVFVRVTGAYIELELKGTALESGNKGDVIPVRVRTKKRLEGKVTEKGKVEKEL